MVWVPRRWENGGITGGYVTYLYSKLIGRVELINSDRLLKESSVISDLQYNAVNYQSRMKFRVNKEMVDFLKVEWGKEDSVLFKTYNKPYAETVSVDVYKSTSKTKIASEHDSKY